MTNCASPHCSWDNPGLSSGVALLPTLTLPSQAFGFWVLILPSEYLMAPGMVWEHQLALPALCSPSSAGPPNERSLWYASEPNANEKHSMLSFN